MSPSLCVKSVFRIVVNLSVKIFQILYRKKKSLEYDLNDMFKTNFPLQVLDATRGAGLLAIN